MNRWIEYIRAWIAFYVLRQFRKMPPEAIDFLVKNTLPKYKEQKRTKEFKLLSNIIKVNINSK